MKKIFLVRHGQTEDNLSEIYQHDADGLSKEGERQAVCIATCLADKGAEVVISSTLKRAQQTAGFLVEKLQLPLESNPLLIECVRPSSWEGKSFYDLEITTAKQEMLQHLDDPEWRYLDGENLADWLGRAQEVIAYIEKHSAETIIVVTHAHFLKVLWGVLLFGDDYSPIVYKHSYENLITSNAGISEFEKREQGWTLVSWNSCGHLK